VASRDQANVRTLLGCSKNVELRSGY